MEKQTPGKVSTSVVENIGESTKTTESGKNMTERANRTDTETVGHAGTMHGNQEAQSKMLQTSSRPANEPVAIPEDAGTAKTTQMSIPRSGSKKLPGLTKMLESDTESLQLDATVSNEDSDDFDFSSDK
ncbi:hypothetical protein L798_05717 [Zootermopsis nevadensis]|uniref:Uncharacterized protein n=1 Tax=Zootermopsis nevadensis TaxID=136037 RepID=A0A067R7L4_ZOONE|nr:hypothetical protein L798_05717 [Zootermopsis nevadensis]